MGRRQIPSPRITLKILYGLRDTSTAESYASSGGSTGVIGTKVGMSAAEGCGLSDWSGWFARSNGKAKEEEKRMQGADMLKLLLEVYMEDGLVSSSRWSRQIDNILQLAGTHIRQRGF